MYRQIDGGVIWKFIFLAGYTSPFMALLVLLSCGVELYYFGVNVALLEQLDLLSIFVIINTGILCVMCQIFAADFRSLIANNHCDGISKWFLFELIAFEQYDVRITIEANKMVCKSDLTKFQFHRSQKAFAHAKKFILAQALLWFFAWGYPLYFSMKEKVSERSECLK